MPAKGPDVTYNSLLMGLLGPPAFMVTVWYYCIFLVNKKYYQ